MQICGAINQHEGHRGKGSVQKMRFKGLKTKAEEVIKDIHI